MQGKELSYNNINDTDAAFELRRRVRSRARRPPCAIIKHANPCGVAEGATLVEAYRKALRCDPVSAFGGIVALNRPLDAEAAREIVEIFTEVIIAPDADEDAIAIVGAKKNLRLLLAGGLPDPRAAGLASARSPAAFWSRGATMPSSTTCSSKVVTKRAPTERELADLRFAFRVAKHVKSNAIVYAKDGATVGIGAGQMSRVDSARIAALQGGRRPPKPPACRSRSPRARSSPPTRSFRSPTACSPAIEAGATAVIQPGGSMRDDEVIAAADEPGIAMVFTGVGTSALSS